MEIDVCETKQPARIFPHRISPGSSRPGIHRKTLVLLGMLCGIMGAGAGSVKYNSCRSWISHQTAAVRFPDLITSYHITAKYEKPHLFVIRFMVDDSVSPVNLLQ